VERLGGPRKALPMIALYLRLPKRLAAERGMAVYLLRGCGREAVPLLVKVLVKELASEDEPVGACWALGCMGPEARGAGPALVKVLESKPSSFWSRFFAVWALGETGAADGSAVPVLVEALKDEYDLVQSAAAQVLGRMGPAAKAAEPELQKLLEALNAKEESSHTIIGPTTFRHASGDSTIVIPKTKDAVIEALKSVRGEGAADAGK
jgi:HEAT repeat protein